MILPIHVSKCPGKKRIFSPVVIVKIIAKQHCNWYLSKLHDLYYTWVTMTLITKYLRIIFGSFLKSMEAAGAKLLYQRSVQLSCGTFLILETETAKHIVLYAKIIHMAPLYLFPRRRVYHMLQNAWDLVSENY